MHEPAEITVEFREGAAEAVKQAVLTHQELNAHNTFETPTEVVPKALAPEGRGASLRCVLPPASVSRLDVQLA